MNSPESARVGSVMDARSLSRQDCLRWLNEFPANTDSGVRRDQIAGMHQLRRLLRFVDLRRREKRRGSVIGGRCLCLPNVEILIAKFSLWLVQNRDAKT